MSYHHLTIEERGLIAQYRKEGLSIRCIASLLERNPSTISRELRRNKSGSTRGFRSSLYYFPLQAHRLAQERRKNCHRKSIHHPVLLAYLTNKLCATWSPDQIAHRAKDAPCPLPSYSTIYRWINKKLLPPVSMKQLRRKGRFKRPSEKRGRFNDQGRTIKKRPWEVRSRQVMGHWEGDTVESGRYDRQRKSSACFVTLVERVSRYYIAILVPNRKRETVTKAIIQRLETFPSDLVKTITFDRGKEFAGYEEIEEALGCHTYFCDPYCAWQKGSNENSNGLLREFYPKGMDLSEVDETLLNHNLNLMNNRPRKVLKYDTPYEVLSRGFQECCT